MGNEHRRVGDAQRYVCEACGEEFESEDELRRHLYAKGLVD